ncbi:MAG: radical SAM protein [Verrucomicrobiota bacterium]
MNTTIPNSTARESISIPSSFTSKRGGSNSWAQSAELVGAFRRGDQFAVMPRSAEYAPILSCNAACPYCPFSVTRHRILKGELVPVGESAAEDDVHASTRGTAFRVIDAAKEAGAKGILFTGGGEPTIWPSLMDALHFCGKSQLHTALYTNGFEIARQQDFAVRLLHPDAALVFCRVSINAASPKASRLHWGVDFPVLDLQLEALAHLLRAREELVPLYHRRGASIPSVQISTIVDKNTVADLSEILQSVSRVFARFPLVRAEDDTMVVRPLTIHGHRRYSTADHPDSVINQIIAVAGPQGCAAPTVNASGLRLFLGFGLDRIVSGEFSTYSELLAREYASRTTSLANGVFLTVGPDATVYPCTEKNCQPAWALGNLKRQSVAEIYGGERRREILAQFDATHWGPEMSQPTPRTSRLDRIAQAIHQGVLTDSMIGQIRELSMHSHDLLLD